MERKASMCLRVSAPVESREWPGTILSLSRAGSNSHTTQRLQDSMKSPEERSGKRHSALRRLAWALLVKPGANNVKVNTERESQRCGPSCRTVV